MFYLHFLYLFHLQNILLNHHPKNVIHALVVLVFYETKINLYFNKNKNFIELHL